jgi:hypothetical protein
MCRTCTWCRAACWAAVTLGGRSLGHLHVRGWGSGRCGHRKPGGDPEPRPVIVCHKETMLRCYLRKGPMCIDSLHSVCVEQAEARQRLGRVGHPSTATRQLKAADSMSASMFSGASVNSPASAHDRGKANKTQLTSQHRCGFASTAYPRRVCPTQMCTSCSCPHQT